MTQLKRIPQVENVTLWRRGVRVEGTLHLTSHHIIFSYFPAPVLGQQSPSNSKPRELWITYPMIAFCTYRPVSVTSRRQHSIRLRCRDFTFVSFDFISDTQARDAFETIRNLTCRLNSLEKLYAFTYQAQGAEKDVNGWTVYNPMQEWRRMGVGPKARNTAWRISDINLDYTYSPTYPARLVVPTTISDNVLNYAGRYRSRVRIPVLTYLHPVNDCSITRCSQPLVGVRGNRSVQDEKLIAAIFATSIVPSQGDSLEGSEVADAGSGASSIATHTPPRLSAENSMVNLAIMEDDVIARARTNAVPANDADEEQPKLYGAQQSNLIVDARPMVNALAMQAVGMGSENMDHYPLIAKVYLNIDNIHVMRDSLNKVVDALKDGDITPLPPTREALAKSNWLKYIRIILDGAAVIARQVGLHHSHVLIHCSDGWDRTSQLSALSQLCLDPYYRTLDGFIVLVEKDFLAFGHMFRHRTGPLSSEKWFDIEPERASTAPDPGRAASHAFESALHSAKGFFKPVKSSKHAAPDPDDSDAGPASSSPSPFAPKTKPKETSPVFHQFLDAVYQMTAQHPTRFEFNERFLRRLLYHLYSAQYGTFLYDSEASRVAARASERTGSVWDYFLARRAQFINDKYEGGVDDNVRGRERLLFPSGNVRWWSEVFGRTDEEMNREGTGGAVGGSVVTGTESAESAEGIGAETTPVVNGSEKERRELEVQLQ